MALKHLLLKNPRLRGWEYGMLRALEEEIIRQTGAETMQVPEYGMQTVLNRSGHGMRFDGARSLLPKKSLKVEADVLWYVLMGPENYELDLFKDWNITAGHRVVYIFDTLQPQFPIIKKLFANDLFNIKITSFHDAVPDLEKLTATEWHAVEQAVPDDLFKPVNADEKVIDFSSYGRRFPTFHDSLLEFCSSNNLYYDYTTHSGRHPAAPEEELYKQYAWHLSHSKFTVSWPVELTSPARAGKLHPITCRWFEAAFAGTVIIGKKPGNELFDRLLHKDLVVPIDLSLNRAGILKRLEDILDKKDELLKKSFEISNANKNLWTWSERVGRMLEFVMQGQSSGFARNAPLSWQTRLLREAGKK